MILDITVVPKSGRFELVLKDGKLKAYLKSPPEKSKANLEIVKELSRLLGCQVAIVSGHKSRHKVISANITESRWQSFLASIKNS
jgi:uncharacterized protein (TIGR00251 family)